MADVELTRAAVEGQLGSQSRELGERRQTLADTIRGRWTGLRFLLGPWRWMLLVYEYIEVDDRAVILTIQDARSSTAATTEGA